MWIEVARRKMAAGARRMDLCELLAIRSAVDEAIHQASYHPVQ
jgi:hypothetical protein